MEVINNDLNLIEEELKRFVETKAGVKGLVDSGLVKLPITFIQPPQLLSKYSSSSRNTVPVIDFDGSSFADKRKQIVDELSQASEAWGVFLLINHGVPADVIEDALQGVKMFHEQSPEVKNADGNFFTSAQLKLAPVPGWRDYLNYRCRDGYLNEEALPQICRHALSEYTKYVLQLKVTLSELLSEALGLCPDYIEKIECMSSGNFVANYYPACPEPDLALGISDHSDPFFMTILAQDNVGGLQVLYDDHWVDVPYVKGSLIVNLSDMMQIISNDKFKSVVHRAVTGDATRTSIACHFEPSSAKMETLYGPLQEIISDDNPPMYAHVSAHEYLRSVCMKEGKGGAPISKFKLQQA
ncbi:hypothetical protein ACFE04_031891 [Oxalis oulophora]